MRKLSEGENYLDRSKRISHPKYALMPGRNFNDRRQFAVTSTARNFRKGNVFVIATSQRESAPRGSSLRSTPGHRSVYWFLDDGRPPIREIKRAKLAAKIDGLNEEFLDLFGPTKRGGELS